MCCLNEIALTNNGKIAITNCGKHYIIEYKNIVIMETQEFLIDFYFNVHDCLNSLKSRTDNLRDIVFNTSNSRMKFIFDIEEIKELNYLLETTYLKIPFSSLSNQLPL